jgi:hypothetical protein
MRFHFGQRPNETGAEIIFAPLQEATQKSRVFGPKFILQMYSMKIRNLVAVVKVMNIRLEQAQNMVNYRVHMKPFRGLHRAVNPPAIHYISQDHPNVYELTNHILHQSLGAPGKTLRR